MVGDPIDPTVHERRSDGPHRQVSSVDRRARRPVRRVIVLADLEDRCPTSMRWAAELARILRVGSVLIAPRVVLSDRAVGDDGPHEFERAVDAVRRWLDDVGAGIDEIVMTTDDPADELRRMVTPSDIAVMGTGAGIGTTSLTFGAARRDLAQLLACPLVVVPAGANPGNGPIVVGLDGDLEEGRPEHASETWARAVAEALDRGVVGVHATTNGHRSALPSERSVGMLVYEQHGFPTEVIRDAVERFDASLVVVEVERHGSVGGLFFGRVADELFREPPAPLAIVSDGYLRGADPESQ